MEKRIDFKVDEIQDVYFTNNGIDPETLTKVEDCILYCIESGLIYPETNLEGTVVFLEDIDGHIQIFGSGVVGHFDSFDIDVNFLTFQS